MTITYSNGTRIDAIILARDEQRLRVALKGSDDLADFTCLNGTWISEELEPVQIQFEWQKRGSQPTLPETEFICSRELASRLIHLLVTGKNTDDEPVPDKLLCLAASGAVA